MKHTFSFVDVETTGGNTKENHIMEVGILRVENGKEVSRIDTLINPKQPIPWYIRRMTGIHNKDVKHAPEFSLISNDISEILEGSIFVAHNASFDYSFLQEELKRSNTNLDIEALCTLKLSKQLYPQYKKHNLGAIIDRFSLPINLRHRAFADAFALWEFLQQVYRDTGEVLFNQSIEGLLTKYSIEPTLIKRSNFIPKKHRFWFK